MVSHCPWEGYQAACHFDHSAVGRQVIWGPEGFLLINREPTPHDCIFSLFLSHLAVIEHCFLGFLSAVFLSRFHDRCIWATTTQLSF